MPEMTYPFPRKDNSGLVLFFLTMVVFLVPFAMQFTGSNYVKLIEDFAYLIALLYSIFIIVQRNSRIIINKTAGIFLIFFFLFMMIGIYYNGFAMEVIQLRELKYLLLPIILVPFNDIDDYKKIWSGLKVIAAVSVPVSIVQWYLYRSNGDYVTGIMGYKSSGILTFFVLIIFFSELGIRLEKREKVIGPYFLYLIPTIINETKITIIIFPIMLFIIMMITKRFKIYTFVAAAIILFALLWIWSAMYKNTYGISLNEVFSYKYLYNYMFATNWIGDAGRLAKVIYAFDVIKGSNLYLGYGLGSSYSGATSGLRGYISGMYYTPEMFGGTRPQIFVSLIEIGVVGTAAVILILILVFKKILELKGNTIERFIAINSFLVVFVSLLYQQVFYFYQIMYLLIIFTVASLKFIKNRD